MTKFVGIYFDFNSGKYRTFVTAYRDNIPASCKDVRCVFLKDIEYQLSALKRFFLPTDNKGL